MCRQDGDSYSRRKCQERFLYLIVIGGSCRFQQFERYGCVSSPRIINQNVEFVLLRSVEISFGDNDKKAYSFRRTTRSRRVHATHEGELSGFAISESHVEAAGRSYVPLNNLFLHNDFLLFFCRCRRSQSPPRCLCRGSTRRSQSLQTLSSNHVFLVPSRRETSED